MKKILLVLLTVVVVAGVLAGAGFAGYRFGFRQGVGAAANGNETTKPFTRGENFGWNNMPMHDFNGMRPGFHQGFASRGDMMRFGRGFGFITPIFFLVRIAIFAFVIWLLYKLLTGWRISFSQTAPKPSEPEIKEENQ